MRRFLLAALLSLLAPAALAADAPRPPLLILLSIDGFRADYLSRGLTPNLSALAKTGVQAPMRPSFPSLTFPNHYTLVTGLVPDHHGVVDNNMTDPAIGQVFATSAKTATDPRWWEGAKPLWVTAEEQGVITASAGYIGAEVLIHGRRPHYLDPWRETRTPAEVAAVALNWLALPADLRPGIEFLYVSNVDHEGHKHTPDSPELNDALRKVDAAVGALVRGLKARRLYDRTNIVIVSDHGMAATPESRQIVMDEVVPPSEGVVRTYGSTSGVDALPGHEEAVAKILLAPHDHFTCWRKAEIPARFHYGSHPRIAQFFCLNQVGGRFILAADVARNKVQDLGNHGFDPFAPEMQAIFIAHGPAFRRGVALPVFDNVDVYPLLTRLTRVRPEKNDGDLAPLVPALSP